MADYELIRRLSSGGMGEVYLARRSGPSAFEKRVALKLMLPHLAVRPEFVARFYREARVAARMHHPNIVEVFDVGEFEGRPYLAMQLVDGLTLDALLRDCAARAEAVPVPIIRLVASCLLDALGFAHDLKDQAGAPLRLVHRDVTPSNVLVARTGNVLLTDFGIALVGDTVHTDPGALRGKLAYLSPEQVTESTPVDQRTDLYAAAVTLWEVATFVHPFRHATDGATLHAITTGEPAGLDRLSAALSPRMVEALRRALSRDPRARPQTAREFREELMDGPLASGPELAEWLAARWPPGAQGAAVGAHTESIVDPSLENAPLTQAQGARPRRRVLGAVVSAALLSLAGLWTLGREPQQVAAPRPTPAPPLPTGPTQSAPPSAEGQPAVVTPPAVPSPNKTSPGPRALKLGYLSADAAPWADVLIGGRVIDRTPFVRHPLPLGQHVLVFKGPSGATARKVVTVSEGAETKVRVDF